VPRREPLATDEEAVRDRQFDLTSDLLVDRDVIARLDRKKTCLTLTLDISRLPTAMCVLVSWSTDSQSDSRDGETTVARRSSFRSFSAVPAMNRIHPFIRSTLLLSAFLGVLLTFSMGCGSSHTLIEPKSEEQVDLMRQMVQESNA